MNGYAIAEQVGVDYDRLPPKVRALYDEWAKPMPKAPAGPGDVVLSNFQMPATPALGARTIAALQTPDPLGQFTFVTSAQRLAPLPTPVLGKGGIGRGDGKAVTCVVAYGGGGGGAGGSLASVAVKGGGGGGGASSPGDRTAGTCGYWVGQSQPVPASALFRTSAPVGVVNCAATSTQLSPYLVMTACIGEESDWQQWRRSLRG